MSININLSQSHQSFSIFPSGRNIAQNISNRKQVTERRFTILAGNIQMKKRIIVIGGGFAGVQLVRKLDKKLFEVLLLDRLNHHQFQPLFYQVATSQIEPSSISFPLRHVFNSVRSTQIRLTEVQQHNSIRK
jgi:NADPH-dependent 2,4-dienoyl-CoA reductase/sulfur reductase-like enzyme